MKVLEVIFCMGGNGSVGFMIFLSVALLSACASADVVLVDRGEPAAVIVLPDEPAEPEQQAAEDLVEHIRLMSGARLSVTSAGEAPEGLLPVFIGAAADARLDGLIDEAGEGRRHRGDPWSFAVVVEEDAIHLRGLSSEGSRTAAYELLEQLGVRWFMPGETGRVMPERTTVTLEPRRIVRVPSFRYRRPSEARDGPKNEEWNRRLGLGGVGRRAGSHSMPGSPNRSEHPEYWGLRPDGRRGANQLCLTGSHDNPDDPSDPEQNHVLKSVIEAARAYYREAEDPDTAILHAGPRDGGGFCECPMCRALDAPDHHTTMFRTPSASRTDRYVWFFEQVLRHIEDEFPKARIGFYAYGALLNPPYDPDYEPSGRLVISMTPIHACRLHGPGNPICPESDVLRWLYEHWAPYVDEIVCQGYWYNLACPGYLFPLVHRLREEIPLSKKLGATGLYLGGGAAGAWASHNPAAYVAGKLQWDHTADADKILADFYEKFYGPAREPMAAYHTLMETTIRDADYHTGSSWDIPNIYTDEARERGRRYLQEAERLANASGEDIYSLRVDLTAKAFELTDVYCRSQQKRNRHDFVGEKELCDRLEQIRDSLLEDYEYPMLNPRHSSWFLNRFTTDYFFPDISGYSRVTDGNEMIVAFDNEWKFQLDPEAWGRYSGFHKLESEGGNWQSIRTDTSWSNQGLRYYFGQTWYRQTVVVPEGYEGRKIKIWFSGVDNTAEVWVNGTFVGANHDGAEFDIDAFGSAFRPFEFDVSDAIRHGEPNVVAVRAVRPRTNELGTGGLVGPAMFYAEAQ